MTANLPFTFPSEASRVKRQVENERGWTPAERIAAAAESLDVVAALAAAGGRTAGQLEYRRRCREQWRRRMQEFFARQEQHGDLPTDR